MTPQRLRLAAYAVCLRQDRLLLARYVSPDGAQRHWTLPGGKVEHAEDPYDAVVREVAEETGYQVEVERLLGVDSRPRHADWGGPRGTEPSSSTSRWSWSAPCHPAGMPKRYPSAGCCGISRVTAGDWRAAMAVRW
jgi:8-oxo-dGTP pyrophosphatase MutT (NUDIX family)